MEAVDTEVVAVAGNRAVAEDSVEVPAGNLAEVEDLEVEAMVGPVEGVAEDMAAAAVGPVEEDQDQDSEAIQAPAVGGNLSMNES